MLKGSELPEIYFATHNQHKSREVGQLLKGLYTIRDLHDLEIDQEIPETGNTLEENSRQKAKYLFHKFGIDCFADDTGLEIDSLDGEPGVRSARYAGEPKDDVRNVDLLLEKLSGYSNPKGRFRTVITLILSGNEYQFEGIVEGTILAERRGSGGFGYDPIFVPEGHSRTFAEMETFHKNTISHRGIAINKLVDFLKSR